MMVKYPLKTIKPKEDFHKMVYALFGMFFEHYEDMRNELTIEQNDEEWFTVYFHWDLTVEERAKLDRLVKFYYDRRDKVL